ncbi:L,D-transpeptidase family protein [Xinfangfangia sp. CPCC 101601]|uniref:L,D-transpeptidase family protein n=1 Tax=Pseudogemmobacter lacusdianii TaxID=3069608 RepID=A0ABU0VX65_9RHOB|nr:L,D-transpeptidase family protein [Xinfangfangia sp. CPCC 101601]MDQ2066352.1 L,D-transpeptidase family protein [Xinfangfangia sp. CPCC 101601]
MTPADLVLTPMGLRFAGRVLPCSIGRGGVVAHKVEGDGGTPAGLHEIVGGFFRPDRLPASAVPAWLTRIGPRDLWSDDVEDPDYNQHVTAPHGYSHEALRRPDPLYDLVLVTDWNWPLAHPGRGSAIFIHEWRAARVPTAGCIALSRSHLLWVAQRIVPGTRLIVPETLAGRGARKARRDLA